MENKQESVKRGIWTPWAQVLCYECHGNENLPNPKTDAEWARMTEPVPLMEDKAVTFCDGCGTDIQVYDSVAYEHNLVQALKDHGFDAVMSQTGGMMSGCSITPSEDLQKDGDPDGIGEILITYNDSGDNLYWMGIYDNDISPADVEWGNISFATQDEVINWACENREKIAKLEAPETERPLEEGPHGRESEQALSELMKEASEKAQAKNAGRNNKPRFRDPMDPSR